MIKVIDADDKIILSNMLEDISNTMLEHDAETPSYISYNERDLANAIYIFNHIAFNKIFEKQVRKKNNIRSSEAEAQEFGELLRALIKEFTEIDTHKLFK